MVVNIHVLIFAASAVVAFSENTFIPCDKEDIHVLRCPEGSIITGIQTSSDLFSADSTPVCSKLADEVLPHPHERAVDYFQKVNDSTYHHFTIPKVICRDYDYAMESISICSVDGDVTGTISNCSHLRYAERNWDTYTVVGDPKGPVLKCEEGSVLHSIMYDRDDEGNLTAVATCTAMDVGKERLSVIDKRDNCVGGELVEVSCPDGFVLSGFEMSYDIFYSDAGPVCSKASHEMIPEIQSSQRVYHFGFIYPDRVIVQCDFDNPIILKFSMCFLDGTLSASTTECGRFDHNVTVTDVVRVEQWQSDSPLKCPEGSFLTGFWKEKGTSILYAYCAVV